jgi:hypothetical protein
LSESTGVGDGLDDDDIPGFLAEQAALAEALSTPATDVWSGPAFGQE